MTSDDRLRSARRAAIAPFIVMDVMRTANALEATGARVLHLEVGQPASPAPKAVLRAAEQALKGERLGYTDALGLKLLRSRIAGHYGEAYGLDVDWRQVVVTTGSSGAFILAFLAAFDEGDDVAVAVPGYPGYRNILQALGVRVVEVPVGPDSHFQPSIAMLEALDPLPKGLIVASPANPTGSMLSSDAIGELAGFCGRHGIRLVSDEIYHGIVYGDRAATALTFDPNVIVINSFSKYYSMTGWRLGWMIVPKPLLRSIECLAQNLYISPPTLSQRAAEAAFACRLELDGHVARYARNRDILLEALPKAGFQKLAPADGAFYVYADVSEITENSSSFCRQLLEQTGVAITPGIDFDPGRGHRFIRISFAGATDEIEEAMTRLLTWRL
ncbi:MAG: pyridoxal phosphate-dependent aminotransferase [Hyphomicrobiales bacterium]|nr:pyridoxal phosphate-dependent aminotransferase [Hyphomicrobiales bacterium]